MVQLELLPLVLGDGRVLLHVRARRADDDVEVERRVHARALRGRPAPSVRGPQCVSGGRGGRAEGWRAVGRQTPTGAIS